MFDESIFIEMLGLEPFEDLRTQTILATSLGENNLGKSNSCHLNPKISNSTILEQSIGIADDSLVIGQADLRVGSSLNFNDKIKNQGTETSDLNSNSFFLSKDTNLYSTDTLLGSEEIASLNPSTINDTSSSLVVDSFLSNGKYDHITQTDANNSVLESNKTNKRFVETIIVNSIVETNNNVVYNSTSGYGTVNAAAAVAQALGQTKFADVVNLNGNNWGADLIKAPEVWTQGYTGQGIVVAVLDTGVDRNHSDLSSNIWQNNDEIAGNGVDDDLNGFVDDVYGWNFASNNNNTLDVRNHGTHVAGTIAGINNNFGVTGIAYSSKIMPVKVFGDQGSGTYSNLIQGIYYAVDNGANVINMSLAGSIGLKALQDAIDYASSNGVIVVSAAGNAGASMPNYPAYYAINDGLAVGAVDKSNKKTGFSNKAGNDPNMAYVTAPGVSIYSTFANNRYGSLSGTSMAAPHVAGVVALMLSANSNLSDSQVRQILIQTSIPLA